MVSAHSRFPSGRYSPLRYPGGKGKLVEFVRRVIRANGLSDGLYVEPYAGGAAVAIELLLSEEVSRIAINDISPQIHSFWSSVLQQPDELCRLIAETPVTLEQWDKQKVIMMRGDHSDPLALGFATFFLNRTNRSGILNGGIIGGRSQASPWKIDARYNAKELVSRVLAIARLSSRISLTRHDAAEFLKSGSSSWGPKTLVYLDPPYYVKGSGLYYHYYRHDDHVAVRQALSTLAIQRWIVSYDDVEPIRTIYVGLPYLRYMIGYSAREHTSGSEIMFFGPGVLPPEPAGSMTELERGILLPDFEPTSQRKAAV